LLVADESLTNRLRSARYTFSFEWLGLEAAAN
jgi:hypothetical protein